MMWCGPKRAWENLAQAVVAQAAKDYRNALRQLRRNCFVDREAHMKLLACRRFFHSRYCYNLTTLDTDKLMRDIEKKVRNE